MSSHACPCHHHYVGNPVEGHKYLLQKLQYVQNAAARLITGIWKHHHITPILMDLHWLPVNERIQFKILLLTFKSLNGLAPVYVDEMIQRYVPNRKLCSSSAFLLKQNKWNLKSYGFENFYSSCSLFMELLTFRSQVFTQFEYF